MFEEFDQIARGIIVTLLGRFPHWGTLSGLHEHDDDLPDAGPEVVAERWNELRRGAERLLTHPAEEMTPDQQTDCAVLRHAVDYMEFTLTGVERWKKDPDALSEIGLAMCVQLTREFAPLDKRMDQLAGRLDKLPDYLTAYRTQVLDPAPLWTDLAIQTTGEMPAFFQAIAATAEHSVSPGVGARLNQAVERAVRATDEYYTWLVQDVRPRATGSWVIGPDAFAELCIRRELGRTPEEIRALGQDLLERGRAELVHLANEVKPGGTVEEAIDVACAEHPRTFAGVLEEYARAMRQCHRFLFREKLVSLPEHDELEFQETPSFLRHLLPVAGYVGPGRFDEIQSGTYFVTQPDTMEEMAALHNASTVYNTTVHEGYPGHHLQAVIANKQTPMLRMLPSLLGSGIETTEGWALYAEHMMADAGFLTSSQRRLIQMRDHCMRAARVLIDVGLHTGEMTVEDAAGFLSDQARMPIETATAEVRMYTLAPGYFMSYMLGAYDMMRLRDDLQARMGDTFDLRWYHDAVLAAGEIPFCHVRDCVERAADTSATDPGTPDA